MEAKVLILLFVWICMGCNETTAMASSGMLFMNSGDFFEQEERTSNATPKNTMENLFMNINLTI